MVQEIAPWQDDNEQEEDGMGFKGAIPAGMGSPLETASAVFNQT